MKLFCSVVVPGDGGSQLQAKLNKTTTVSYVCEAKTNYYFDLWLNIELLLPFVIDCFVDNMRYWFSHNPLKTGKP